MSKKKQPFNEWKHEVSFDMWQGELQNYEDGGEVSASSSPSFWERTFGGSNDGSPSGLAAYEGYTQEDAVRDAGFANVAEAQALGKSLENITPRDILEFVPVVGDLLGAEEIYRELQKAEPNWTLVGILGGATVIGLVPGAGDAAASAIKAGARKAASITGTATADVIGAARALADGDLTGHLVEHRGSKSSSQGSSVGARAAARNDYLIVDPTTGEHIPFKSDALVEDIVAATGADKKSFSKPRARGVGTTKPFEGYPAGTKIFRADQPPTKSPVVKTTQIDVEPYWVKLRSVKLIDLRLSKMLLITSTSVMPRLTLNRKLVLSMMPTTLTIKVSKRSKKSCVEILKTCGKMA